MQILPTCQNDDFLLESTGTLANLPLHEINIDELVRKHSTLEWLQSNLAAGKKSLRNLLKITTLFHFCYIYTACAQMIHSRTIC